MAIDSILYQSKRILEREVDITHIRLLFVYYWGEILECNSDIIMNMSSAAMVPYIIYPLDKIFEYKNGRFPMVGWRCWHGISLQFTSLMPNPLSHLVATGEQDFDPTEHHLGSIVLSWCRALAFIETNANSLNVIE